MPQFVPDQVTFQDIAGYGMWDNGHYREHLQFVQTLSGKTPPINIANYDVLSFLNSGSSRKSQLEAHWDSHKLLHAAAGITSVDLSVVDLDNQDDFYSWLSYHSQVHAQIRQFLGLV